MASILKVDTITGVTTAGSIAVTGEGNSTTTNLQQGLAKSWSRVDPNTISDSFNVSSLTDAGTGLFEDNFTNAFSAATYSSVASPGGSTNIQMMFATNMTTYTTSASRTAIYQNATGYRDEQYSASRFGDLA